MLYKVQYFCLLLQKILGKKIMLNIENIKSQMRKGFLEYCILLIINKKATYAPDIIKELKEANLIVVEGTLYPLLTRLKNDNLLSYQWVESNQGPPRKYYEITELGQKFLLELEKSWEEIQSTINAVKS